VTTATPGEAARRYLAAAEHLPFAALAATDWRRMPPRIKRYPGGPGRPAPGLLGELLRGSHGLTRYQWDNWRLSVGVGMDTVRFIADGRPLRPAPSAGGLSSAELYVVGTAPRLEPGAYHYDCAADALDLVREGACPANAGLPDGRLYVLIGSVYFRTAFKYHEFGYRLQCLDAGVLAAQVISRATAAGAAAMLVADFDEPAAAETLGLDPDAETILAAIALRLPAEAANGPDAGPEPTVHGIRSVAARATARTRPVPVLAALPLTSALRSADRASRGHPLPEPAGQALLPASAATRLPSPRIAIDAALGARRSADAAFGIEPLSLDQVGAIAWTARTGWSGELKPGHVPLFFVVRNVTGLEPGVYVYDVAAHRLVLVCPADPDVRAWRSRVQGGSPGDQHAGLVIYPAGDYATGFATAADSWYRLQNLAAGMVAQRIALGAAAMGLGCRLVCSYDPEIVAFMLRAPDGVRPLCQLMIGPVAGTVSYTQPMPNAFGRSSRLTGT